MIFLVPHKNLANLKELYDKLEYFWAVQHDVLSGKLKFQIMSYLFNCYVYMNILVKTFYLWAMTIYLCLSHNQIVF